MPSRATLDDDPAAGDPGGLCRRLRLGRHSRSISRCSAGCSRTGSMNLSAARCWSIPRRCRSASSRLLTSLVVALGGLCAGLAGLSRASKPARSTRWRKRLGAGLTVLKNKYYFDELYDFLFVQPGVLARGDLHLPVDGSQGDRRHPALVCPHLAAIIGHFFRNYIDKPVVNGSGDWIARKRQEAGRRIPHHPDRTRPAVYDPGAGQRWRLFSAVFYYLLLVIDAAAV